MSLLRSVPTQNVTIHKILLIVLKKDIARNVPTTQCPYTECYNTQDIANCIKKGHCTQCPYSIFIRISNYSILLISYGVS